MQEIEEIFLAKNQNCPLPSYLMNSEMKAKGFDGPKGLELRSQTESLKHLQKYLLTRYKEVFRIPGGGKRISRPYININNFMDGISELRSGPFGSKEFEDLNQKCYLLLRDMSEKEKKRLGISERMMQFWDEHGVYVGFRGSEFSFNDIEF
jgi:hypothetical protein